MDGRKDVQSMGVYECHRRAVSVRETLLASSYRNCKSVCRTPSEDQGKNIRVWNRERFVTDSYKEMGDLRPKNPKVTESFQEVPLKAKGEGWAW